jgi:hypothetical protein
MSGGSLRSREMKRSNSIHARRVDLGDAQRVAHRRVGRRAAALAQDAAAAGEADDVVHGEEIRLVAELGDQRELVLDLRAHLVRRAAFGPALRRPLRSAAQPVESRVSPGGTSSPGIRSAARRARTCSARRSPASRPAAPAGRAAPARPRAQVALAVGNKRAPASHRHAVADRGQRVLQRARRRTCMWTSPLATAAARVSFASSRAAREALGRRARGCNSTASQARLGKRVAMISSVP